jgi:hypothetical protein
MQRVIKVLGRGHRVVKGGLLDHRRDLAEVMGQTLAVGSSRKREKEPLVGWATPVKNADQGRFARPVFAD